MSILKVVFKRIYKFLNKIPQDCNVKFGTSIKKTILEGHNSIGKNSNINNCNIGYGTYIGNECDLSNVYIGKFSSIGSKCYLIRGNHPTNKFVSTHPAFYSTKQQAGFTYVKEQKFDEYRFIDSSRKVSAYIGNDVWIGHGVKLLEGIKIGDGSVIAAGSVVTKDIPPYTICGGIPSRVIKQRFNKEEIDFLMEFKWWNKDIKWIESNCEYFDDIKIFMDNSKI